VSGVGEPCRGSGCRDYGYLYVYPLNDDGRSWGFAKSWDQSTGSGNRVKGERGDNTERSCSIKVGRRAFWKLPHGFDIPPTPPNRKRVTNAAMVY
jgi:hypothetical protein